MSLEPDLTTFNKLNRLAAAAVFLIALAVYLQTVAPTVSFWDCGEFITTSYILGVPHPPGAPLYTLLGRLFSMLPFSEEIAFRVNLLSVLSGAATALLIHLCVVRLLSAWLNPADPVDRIAILTGGVVAALSTAFSTSFWDNATEAEVYGLTMCLTLLAVWLALRWDDGHKDRRSDRLLLFIAYLFGLGAGIHLQCLLTVPGILILVFTDLLEDRSISIKYQILCVVGLTLYPFLAILLPLPQAFGGPVVIFSIALSILISLTVFRSVWDNERFWLWGILIGLGYFFVYSLAYFIWSKGDTSGLNGSMPYLVLMTLSILAALIVLRSAWRNPGFWAWGILLASLGFSTYFALYIRSGHNPAIDMNNPETWHNFKAFLARQQYGTHALFPRRGAFWAYQMNIHVKYFLQQFPFYDAFTGAFRRAVEVYGSRAYEALQYSLIPIFLGIGGAVYHFRRDWKRFAAIFAMFALMGFGLVLYLNMPDPEPRELEYIFVGAYTFFGFWMGIGAAGIVAWVGRELASVPLTGALAILFLLIPLGIMQGNLVSQDRTGDMVSHDYAYNILQTCEPNAVLFTNGDNDTYPLWFLQYVKGIRQDVRVVNLSLIKTPWYVQQLRDLQPSIPLPLTDAEIESELMPYPLSKPSDMEVAGLHLNADEIPTAEYFVGNTDRRMPVIESHTRMIWNIVHEINWSRPIYFAVTVPNSNLAGLRPYLSMEGMAYRLVKERALGQFDTRRTAHNLLEVYHYNGIADSTVYKDTVARRLLGNYLVIFEGLVRAYIQQGLYSEAFRVLQKAETRVPPHAIDGLEAWSFLSERYRDLAKGFADAGNIDSAVLSVEELLRATPPDLPDRDRIEDLIRTWKNRDSQVIVP